MIKSSEKEEPEGLSLLAQFDDICRYSERMMSEMRDNDKYISFLANKLKKVNKLYSESKKENVKLSYDNAALEEKENALVNRLKHAKELWSRKEKENKYLKRELKSLGKRFGQIKEIITAGEPFLTEESIEKIVLLSRSSLETVKSSLKNDKNKSCDSLSMSHMDGDIGISFDDTADLSCSLVNEVLTPVEPDAVHPNGNQETIKAVSEKRKSRGETFNNILSQTAATPGESSEWQECIKPSDSSIMSSNSSSVVRDHIFVLEKMLDGSTTCIPCGKRIDKSCESYRCSECHVSCHSNCMGEMLCFCQPIPETTRNGDLTISECAPSDETPMVPPLISFCLKRIEEESKNGSLYGVTPPEEDIQELLDHFSKGDDGVKEKTFDVSVLCGAVKVYLSRLADPLIPGIMKRDFLKIAREESPNRMKNCCDLVHSLPQANRDTLASVILHMHKLGIDSGRHDVQRHLIYTFTPIVFGPHRRSNCRSESSPSWRRKVKEDELKVMELMMIVPLDFWSNILKYDEVESDNDSFVIIDDDDPKADDVQASEVPSYSSIYIPYSYFKYVLDQVEEDSLEKYIDHLQPEEEVPYMLTEYIRDKGKQRLVRERLTPLRIPRPIRQKILEQQPQLSLYFKDFIQ